MEGKNFVSEVKSAQIIRMGRMEGEWGCGPVMQEMGRFLVGPMGLWGSVQCVLCAVHAHEPKIKNHNSMSAFRHYVFDAT